MAIKEWTHKPPTAYSKGIRLGNFPQIRDANDTALESVFTGSKTAKQAMQAAVKSANRYLARFNEMAGGK